MTKPDGSNPAYLTTGLRLGWNEFNQLFHTWATVRLLVLPGLIQGDLNRIFPNH